MAEESSKWETLSDHSAYGLAAFSLLYPIYIQDWRGLGQSALVNLTTATLIDFGKSKIDAKRPDGSDLNSFPSQHTGLAFTSATALHKRYGFRMGVPAYTLACITAYARVKADKHYTDDTLASALLGIVIGWNLTDQLTPNIQLTPWIENEHLGLAMSWQFSF